MNTIFVCLVLFLFSFAHAQPESPYMFMKSAQAIQTECKTNIEQIQKTVVALTKIKAPTFENLVIVLEDAMDEFKIKSNFIILLSYGAEQKELRDASNQCRSELDNAIIDIFSNEDLYKQFASIKDTKAYRKLKNDSKRLFDDYYRGFVANGLYIQDLKKRERIKQLNKEVSELALEFDKNVVEIRGTLLVTKEELDGMDQAFIERLQKKGKKYVLTLDMPVFIPLVEQANNEEVRKKMSTLFAQRGGKENVKILEAILEKRSELAVLMGYAHHAEKVMDLSDRMARDVTEIDNFIESLVKDIKPLYEHDLNKVKQLKCQQTQCEDPEKITVYEWDTSYFVHKMKKEMGDLDFAKIKEYFPLNTVTQGMFEIYQTLLGLTFKEVQYFDQWHKDVQLFEVWDAKTKELVGHFYLDLFPREGKYKHAMAYNMVKPKLEKDGSYRKTMSAMFCNFTPPTDEQPSLLSHSEVETYFHEFGHVMHGIVSKTRYPSQGGTSVPRDFVEAPSQMLENWVWNPETLMMLSGHYQTGQKLPKETLDQMIALKNIGKGLFETTQLLFGAMDMDYHKSKGKVDSTEMWKEKSQLIRKGIEFNEGTYRQAAFAHFVGGYDVGYYGYLWSRVYAQDMFSIFEKEGVLNPKTGLRYRKFILEPGKSEDTFVLLKKFLKRKPNNKAFIKSLGL